MNPLAVRDAMRLAESAYSGNLWRRQLAGEQIFTSTTYDPIERIAYYNARNKRYAGYMAKHIAGGSTWEQILSVIDTVLGYIPEVIKEEVMKYIITFIKNLIFGKDNK